MRSGSVASPSNQQESESLSEMMDRTKNILLLVFSVLMVIALSEVVARVVLPVPQRVVVQRDSSFEARLLEERTHQREYALPTHPEQGGIYIETISDFLSSNGLR